MAVPVLFLGNSYTEVNALDQVVAALLREGAAEYAEAEATRLSAGGLRFTDHVDRATTDARWEDALLTGDTAWRWALLQEQSQIPGFYGEDPVWEESATAAAQLDAWLGAKGAQTWLLLTWGRRDGDSTNPGLYPDFPTMQDELTEGTLAYQARLSTAERPVWVAPAGLAFARLYEEALARGEDPRDGLFGSLYASDGSHPSHAGTYLAACVVYTAVTGQSPVGLSAPAEVPAGDVLALQEAAAATVLEGELGYPWSGGEDTGGDTGTGDSGGDSGGGDSSGDSGGEDTEDTEDPTEGTRCSATSGSTGLMALLISWILTQRRSYNRTVLL